MDVLKELEKASISPRESLTGRVVVVLKRFVLSDAISAGDRLPAERQMADRLNISRTVLREALNQLIGEGILVRVSPRILQVAEFDRASLIASMENHDHGDIDFRDLMQIRYILEVGMMPLICEQVTKADIVQLGLLAEVHRTEIEAGRSGNAADVNFHSYLLKILDNSVVKRLTPIIEEQISSFLLRKPFSLDVDSESERSGVRVISEHRELIDALSNNDPKAALECITRHLAPYLIELQQLNTAR